MATLLADKYAARKAEVNERFEQLRANEEELNRIFGRQMAAACSIAILIGKKRSEPLHEGLREGGFAEENIHVVANLDEATALLARTTQPGDVVLFENDLPDNYDE